MFFDTETTDVIEPRMIQFAATFMDFNPLDNISIFFKPEKVISIEAMAVHHITPNQLKDCDTVDKHRSDIQHHLDNNICVAHNLEFDLQVLTNESFTLPKEYICTQLVAEKLKDLGLIQAEKVNLQYLRYYFELYDLKFIIPHDALSDCKVLSQVFSKMSLLYSETFSISFKETIKMFQEMTKEGMDPGNFKIPFGKYQGVMLRNLDKDYMYWCLDNMQSDSKIVKKIKDFLMLN